MKTQHLVAIALVAMASATSVAAHQVDPGGKIKVACSSDNVRMAAINRAVASSSYRATHSARRKMLSLAQQACARGVSVVTFVPPADEDMCETSSSWLASCRNRTATAHGTPDSFSGIVP